MKFLILIAISIASYAKCDISTGVFLSSKMTDMNFKSGKQVAYDGQNIFSIEKNAEGKIIYKNFRAKHDHRYRNTKAMTVDSSESLKSVTKYYDNNDDLIYIHSEESATCSNKVLTHKIKSLHITASGEVIKRSNEELHYTFPLQNSEYTKREDVKVLVKASNHFLKSNKKSTFRLLGTFLNFSPKSIMGNLLKRQIIDYDYSFQN